MCPDYFFFSSRIVIGPIAPLLGLAALLSFAVRREDVERFS